MKKFWTLILALALIIACSTENKEANTENENPSTADWIAKLDSIDARLFAAKEFNKEEGWKAFGAFRDFARKNPEHPMAPTYHMKAAAIARNIPGKALMAIEEYSTVYNEYPKDTLAPQAQFLVGFTFDQALNDGPRATKAYQAFIEAWPNHPLAAQAKDLIALLNTEENDLDKVKTWQQDQ